MSGTRHVERDALAALRDELTRAAARRASRRSPRRRAGLAVALAACLVGATGAAAALTNTSTGVPAVDELLSIERIGGRSGLPTGDATEPLAVPIGDGRYRMVAYLTRGGEVRIAFAEPHIGGVRGGGGGGWTAADLARRLERRGTDLHGAVHGPDQRVFYGFADGAVRSVRVKDDGDWIVKMSDPWTPAAPGARPLRLLVVIDERDIDVGGDGVQPGELDSPMQPTPELVAVYAK